MATLSPVAQEILDPFRGGLFVCVTKVNISGSSDTLVLPEGLQAAGHVSVLPSDTGDTAPSVSSISQSAHPAGVTVTLASGGTAGASMLVISLHAGNAAGL